MYDRPTTAAGERTQGWYQLAIKNFLVDLLCIFAPLLAYEVWQVRRTIPSGVSRLSRVIFALSCLVSAVVSTLFNIPLPGGVSVNLAIVSLSLAFFVLPWLLGLAVVGLYVVCEVLLAIALQTSSPLSVHAVWQILVSLPHQLVMVAVYALVMCICSMVLRNQRAVVRGLGFIGSLVCYSLLNYIYNADVIVRRHHGFSWSHFTLFIVAINLTFALAARVVVAGQKAQAARFDAIRLEKLQVISDLAASVAHEIRTPITVVRGFTQLILSHDPGRDRTVEFMQNMIEELDKAEAIIADYLQLAKKQIDDVHMVLDLSRIVSGIVEVLRRYAAENHVIIRSTIANDINVDGNEVQVSQAVTNLVKNAIESHTAGGTVEVSLKSIGDRLELKVADSGRGIEASDLPKLGTPYYSTRSHDTGLGLTLTYKVVSEMNGKIRVHSRVGKGTVFTVQLPRSLHQGEPSRASHATVAQH